jgi:hypothetical protein
MKTKNLILMFSLLLVIVMLSSCADVEPIKECLVNSPYGFWGGLWHGMISPISFIGSLFSNDIAIYAVNNNGGWYNFGFVLSSGILSGGGLKLINIK